MTLLGTLNNALETYAFTLSTNGQVIAGVSYEGYNPFQSRPVIWTAGGGPVGIDLPAGFIAADNLKLTADGTQLFADLHSLINGTPKTEPFIWSAQNGWQGLGVPEGMHWATIQAISADGATLIGFAGTNVVNQYRYPYDPESHHFYWSAAQGWRLVAEERAVLLAVSADGRYAAGTIVAPGSTTPKPARWFLGRIGPCDSRQDPTGPWLDDAGAIKTRLVFNEREQLQSGEVLSQPSLLGFNAAAQFALIAAADCEAPSSSSNNFLVRVSMTPTGPVKTLSSFSPSPERLHRGLGICDDGGVLGLDLYDSLNDPNPPIGNARKWNGGSFQLMPGDLWNYAADEASLDTVLSRAASAQGSFYLVALDRGGATETRVLNAQGNPIQTFPDVLPLRGAVPDYPGVGGQVADNGSFLGAPSLSPNAARLYRTDGSSISLGASVEKARLSSDGTFVAYLNQPPVGTASLVIRSVHPGGTPVLTTIPTSQQDLEVDPFEGWMDKDGQRDIDVNEVSGGVSAFRDVLAIERVSRPFGDQIMTLVEVLETNGAPAFYYLRSSATTGKVFGSGRLPRIPEAVYFSADYHSESTTATLNRHGQVLMQERIPRYDSEGVSLGQNLALALFNANTFTKFKQTAYGHRLNGLAANPATRWFNQPVNPNLPVGSQKNFASIGCTLTAMASISSWYGLEITPLEVRDIMLERDAMNVNVARVGEYRLTVGNRTLVRVNPVGGNFETIVQELRGNNPVLLFVPMKNSSGVLKTANDGPELQWPNGSYKFNSRGHYIVAWGIRPSLPAGAPVTTQDILIADPAYQYSSVYGNAYAPPGEELVHVTLADYFDRNVADPAFEFDALQWFNEGRFRRKNMGNNTWVVLSPDDKDRQVQRWRIVEGAVPANPVISVNSPVAVAITVGGVRYVSDLAIAGPSDVVLQKDFSQNIGEFDEEAESGVGADAPAPEFPPYTLALPAELAGLSLDFEIVGVGDGPYTISLNPDKPGATALNTLQGNITTGVTNTGRITVQTTVNTNTFAAWITGFASLGEQTGFSDDPDGDGIINGFEHYFGTHPGQTNTGLSILPNTVSAAFRHPLGTPPAVDVVAHYEWSLDLITWHASGESAQSVEVTLTPVPSPSVPGHVEVQPAVIGSPKALFYRIRLQRLIPQE